MDRRQLKATSIYVILQDIIDTELGDIEKYINEVADDISVKQKKVDLDFETALKKVDNEEIERVNTFFEDDIHKYHKILPIYTFNPTLLMLYGLLETWLKKLCDYHHKRRFSNIKVSDLAGNNYIEKSRKYLNLVADIDIESTETEWREIVLAQKIRNCIAHNNSNIITNRQAKIEKQELYNIIKEDNRFDFDERQGNFFIRDKEYLFDIIKLFKSYLTNITTQLSHRKVYARNTTMPYDNTNWGQEKTESLLKDIIIGLQFLDLNEQRKDEFKDTDLKHNLREHFGSMAWNLTKLYAFFCDADWEVNDRDKIYNERENGLDELTKIYKSE